VRGIRSLLRSNRRLKNLKNPTGFKPTYFVFCDRKTGAARFRVDADESGNLPLDRAASLLAIYCMAHRRSPDDFLLVFGSEADLIDSIAARASTLLEAAGVYANPVGLSRREEEVLGAVAQNLANKEIAARLGISERTIKFHVSSLLNKLGARDRVELSRFCAEQNTPAGWARSEGRVTEFDARNTPRETPSTQLSKSMGPRALRPSHAAAS
jgi:DNA-binding CsgD family transcriptional regulator